jgi:hypothetical protein
MSEAELHAMIESHIDAQLGHKHHHKHHKKHHKPEHHQHLEVKETPTPTTPAAAATSQVEKK